MTPETAHPPARHGHHPSARRGGAAEPSIPVGTSAGLRANVLSFILALASGLAQGWALISLGRGLGDLLPGVEGGAWRSHLAMAAAAAVLACAGQLMVEAIARSSAAEQEGAIRTRLLGHIFALGPARAAESRSGASVSLLTDGAERVALYRQTFLAPTVAACLSPALVLVLLAATVDWVPAAVLMIAVVLVPGAIIGLHSKVRRSSAKSRAQRFRLAAEYLDAIQGLTTLTLAAIQLTSTPRLADNIVAMQKLVAQAAAAGANWVLLPEYWAIMGLRDSDKLAHAEPYGAGILQTALAQAAQQHQIHLFGGTIPLTSPTPNKARNSLLVYSPSGECLSRYDKIHLFNYQTASERYCESDTLLAGETIPQLEINGWRVAQGICYDLRFP